MQKFRELKGRFGIIDKESVERASKFVVLTGNDLVDYNTIVSLDMYRESLASGIKTDLAKYNLVESYKTNITWTINCRSLQNFLRLRTASNAHFEIRELAHKVFNSIPEEYRYLLVDSVEEEV